MVELACAVNCFVFSRPNCRLLASQPSTQGGLFHCHLLGCVEPFELRELHHLIRSEFTSTISIDIFCDYNCFDILHAIPRSSLLSWSVASLKYGLRTCFLLSFHGMWAVCRRRCTDNVCAVDGWNWNKSHISLRLTSSYRAQRRILLNTVFYKATCVIRAGCLILILLRKLFAGKFIVNEFKMKIIIVHFG